MSVWYRAGTVDVTNGSKTVTGTNTQWLNLMFGVMPGTTFYGPDGKPYEIDRVVSDTSLLLITDYSGATASAQAYSVDPTRSGSVASLAAQTSEVLKFSQEQFTQMQTWVAGPVDADVTLQSPAGPTVVVPSLSKMNAENKTELDKRVLKSGGTISNLRRAGQTFGSLIANVAQPLPDINETTTYNSIAVKLRQGWSDTMVRFRLVIRDYFNKHRNVDITFSGYAYSAGQNWVPEASEASAVGAGALDWRVSTHKAQDGNPIIYFHNPNGFDDFSTVEIVDDVSRGIQPVYALDRAQGALGTPVKVSRHYHTGNIVGQVNLSDGVPSGAIIERGANANGEYVKFADGTMVCCLSNFNIPETALSARFGRVRGLPAAFSSLDGMKPVASVLSTNAGSFEASGALYRNGFSITILSESQIDFAGYTYVSPIQTPLTIGIQVIGRWS